jgi:hypothetical protein
MVVVFWLSYFTPPPPLHTHCQIVPLLKPLFGMTDEVLFTEGCVGW